MSNGNSFDVSGGMSALTWWFRHLVPAAGLAAALAVPGPAAARPVVPADRAPECVRAVVLAQLADGTVQRVHLEFCGSGPGGDSALRDAVDGHVFVLDGARRIGRDCGGRADPCVIFPR